MTAANIKKKTPKTDGGPGTTQGIQLGRTKVEHNRLKIDGGPEERGKICDLISGRTLNPHRPTPDINIYGNSIKIIFTATVPEREL